MGLGITGSSNRMEEGVEVKVRLLATAVTLALSSIAWAASAAAGNPHGTPPGQQKASDSTAATASVQANAGARVHGKAQAKGHAVVKANGHAVVRAKAHTKSTASAHAATTVHGQTTASVGVPRSSVSSRNTVAAASSSKTKLHGHGSATVTTALGVKPSNVTGKNTFAAATSNQTKLYGNGTTAGQIAIAAGFGGSMLFGPGNSQPHKAACGPHMIDVHALKAHAAACTTPAAAASVTSSVSPAVSAQATVGTTAAAQAAAKGGVKGAKVSAPAKKHSGGVLGARAKLATVTKPVSRALLATVRHGTLPFTGLDLWMPIALGLGLIATGYALRRKAHSLP